MTIRSALSEMYEKNREDLRALLRREYPPFFYRDAGRIGPNEIPVFAFHSVEPERFEAQMAFLAGNGYRAVDADGLADILLGNDPARENTVALTFDDGRGSLWSTAYPILKKYGFRAIAFLVTGRIRDSEVQNPSLEDVWKGKTDASAVLGRDAEEPFLTWKEIRAMHRSGVVDFQSHTSWHHSVYVSGRLVEFANPSLPESFLNGSFHPVVRRDGRDVVPDRLEWGTPIYEWGPGAGSETRYLEDEGLTQALTEYVRNHGGSGFFDRPGWRKTLRSLLEDHPGKNGRNARYQTAEERYADILDDLLRSKRIIEEKTGTKVSHLCYPWFRGCGMAVRASKEAGYASNHWGLPGGKTVNRVGDDPYCIARMIDDYLFLLPGRGRKSLLQVLMERGRKIAEGRLSKGRALRQRRTDPQRSAIR